MALDFPSAPSDGQVFPAPNGVDYVWNAAAGLWQLSGVAGGLASSWRQLGRIVPVAGQATVEFTSIPADINDLEFSFDVLPTDGAADFVLQFFDAAGDLITDNYGWLVVQGSNANPLGSPPGVYNNAQTGYSGGIIINGSIDGYRVSYPLRGHGRIPNIRDASRPKGVSWQCSFVEQTAQVLMGITGEGQMGNPRALSGFRLLFGATTFAAGGAVTLWGSP